MCDEVDHVQGLRETPENDSVGARKPAGQELAHPASCDLPGFRVRYRHGPRNDLQNCRLLIPKTGIRRNGQPDIEGIETVSVADWICDIPACPNGQPDIEGIETPMKRMTTVRGGAVATASPTSRA